MHTTPTETERDAVFCAAFVDAVMFGNASTVEYLDTWIDECDQQRQTAAAAPNDPLAVSAARYWQGRADAYRDALRVIIDVAAPAAHRAVARADDERGWYDEETGRYHVPMWTYNRSDEG